jgi:hypothetical protein
MDFPDWMLPLRVMATFLIWGMFPVLLYLTWSNRQQWKVWRQWEADEAARRERWTDDMRAAARLHETAAKLHEEASHLRIQAEISLAQARQQMLKSHPGDDYIVKE